MNKTLIVVDMQNDFVYGPLGTPAARDIIDNVLHKIMEYEANGDEIIFTQDTHYGDYLETNEGRLLPIPHCIHGTNGWNIVDGLEVPNAGHIRKHTFGWDFWNLVGTSNVEIIGVCTDICVISNALIIKSRFPEINITVDANCCAGTTHSAHRAALLTMKSCQIKIIND